MAYQLQGVLTLAVATDRLLAVMIPLKYLKFGIQYTVITLIGPYLFVGTCTTINAMITLQDNTPVSSLCFTGDAVSSAFYCYMLLLRIGCVTISALLYVVIAAQLKKHFARIEKTQVASRESSQFGSIRRSTITIGLSTVNAVLFLLLPDIIKYMGIFNYSRSYITTLYSLSMTNVSLAKSNIKLQAFNYSSSELSLMTSKLQVVLNAFIFAYRHKEIMESFKQFICILLRRGRTKDTKTSDIVCRVVPSRRVLQ
ncbi:hypothetical protein ANCCAN_18949 [Ancylostoma caninum]|uniref:G-protein coupled receptors family 1 profile domain-containing protein n=1 Tax=Ancylostoma caninum TaxID=29170 RepID=A0A368FSJ7_ANCCA|nr:hypothetical protein ANCCAN_18949 [Ancylostoma caninum]